MCWCFLDLTVSASVALVLASAALLAGYIRALRAARVDPSQDPSV